MKGKNHLENDENQGTEADYSSSIIVTENNCFRKLISDTLDFSLNSDYYHPVL